MEYFSCVKMSRTVHDTPIRSLNHTMVAIFGSRIFIHFGSNLMIFILNSNFTGLAFALFRLG